MTLDIIQTSSIKQDKVKLLIQNLQWIIVYMVYLKDRVFIKGDNTYQSLPAILDQKKVTLLMLCTGITKHFGTVIKFINILV